MPDLPTMPVQVYLLENLLDPKAPGPFRESWVLSRAVRIRPGLDPRRLRRTVDRLLRRHDGLRTRFTPADPGEWRVVLQDKPDDVFTFEDHGEQTGGAETAIVHAAAAEPLPIDGACLLQVRLLRFGAKGDVLLLRLHHAISDAYGMIVLIEDLIKTYLGVPFLRKPKPYATVIANWNKRSSTARKTDAAFWEAMHRPVIPAPVFGRTARGHKPVPVTRAWDECAEFVLPDGAARVASLMDRAERSDASPFAFASSAFLEAVCAQADVPEIYFCTTVGRSSGMLAGTIVDPSQWPILRYRAQPGATPEKRAAAWAAKLADALAHLPSETASRGGPAERALHADGAYPRQFATWMTAPAGRMDQSEESALFSATPDVPLKLGPIEITLLSLPAKIVTLDELCLKFDTLAKTPQLSFIHAADGYSKDDLNALANAMEL